MAPYDEVKARIMKASMPPPPGTPFAVPLQGTEREGRSPIYRRVNFEEQLLTTFDPDMLTMHDMFERSAMQRSNHRCLGHRQWDPVTQAWTPRFHWLTYAQVAERRKNFGAGIVQLHKEVGVTAEKYGVGVWLQNRPEWLIADLGLASQSLYLVSLYATLGPDTSEYIIKHTDLVCVVTSLPNIPAVLKIARRCPSLKLIVSVDPLVEVGEQKAMSKLAILNDIAKEMGIAIHTMDNVEKIGAASGRPMHPPRPEDITTINYTSGTTGMPKGVVLTHANAVSAVAGSQSSNTVGMNDIGISYLPLAHIFGRLSDQTLLAQGASIGYFHGEMTELLDDLKVLKPTVFMSVPRLWTRFRIALGAGTVEASGFKGALSRHVVETKLASMKLPNGKAHNTHFLWDRIWTPKVLAAIGLERCTSMVSGSAPLDPETHTFLRAVFGNHFVQGYGLTETYAAASFQVKGDFTTGNCGPVAPNLECCLESIPDMEYTVHDRPNPRGELLLRGPSLFKCYYKDPEETARSIDSEGWFHTGDVAEIDGLGRIRIIDRKKNVLKLAQGEYISPERIENVYLDAMRGLVTTAFVYGDSTQAALVGIFGIDPVVFAPWASNIVKQNLDPTDVASIRAAAQQPAVKKACLTLLDDIGKRHKFNSFEKVKNIYLEVDPFTVENELLTPTLKLKRSPAAKAFRTHIEQMYAELAAMAASLPGKAKL